MADNPAPANHCHDDHGDNSCMSGYLAIEEEDHSNQFRLCYFILNKSSQTLTYYNDKPESESSAVILGYVNLGLVSNVVCAEVIRPAIDNCIALYSAGKKLFLSAPTHEEMQCWIRELNSACRISVPKTDEEKDVMRHRLSSEEVQVAKQLLTRTHSHTRTHSNVDVDSSCDELESDYVIVNEGQVIKSGYCVKLGAVVKNWKRRWFTLDEYCLRYYKNETAWTEKKRHLGKIDLHDIRDIRPSVDVHPGRDNLFEIATGNRIFYIQTDTPTDMQSWLATIASVQKVSKSTEQSDRGRLTTWM